MATGSEESDPSPTPVIAINTVGAGPKPARPWYGRIAYWLPAIYLTVIVALWLMVVVIPPAVELPVTPLFVMFVTLGPVGLICLFLGLPMTQATVWLMFAASAAVNCFLLYLIGRCFDFFGQRLDSVMEGPPNHPMQWTRDEAQRCG